MAKQNKKLQAYKLTIFYQVKPSGHDSIYWFECEHYFWFHFM